MKVLPNVKILTDMTKFTEEYKKISEFNENKAIKMLSKLYENSFEISYALAYREKINPQPYIESMMSKLKQIKSKKK